MSTWYALQTALVLQQPGDEDEMIWRYMDFDKFMSLLDRRALFFARSDKLGDRFEGSYPRRNIEELVEVPDCLPGVTQEDYDQLRAGNRDTIYLLRMAAFISCWHANSIESASMWESYLRGKNGVAIQTTVRRLKASMPQLRLPNKRPKARFEPAPRSKMEIGYVKYIDYEKVRISEDIIVAPIAHKRKYYEDERELRAIIFDFGLLHEIIKPDFDPTATRGGYYVTVNLATLLERVVTTPKAALWFEDLVRSQVRRYRLNPNIVSPSSLAGAPMY